MRRLRGDFKASMPTKNSEVGCALLPGARTAVTRSSNQDRNEELHACQLCPLQNGSPAQSWNGIAVKIANGSKPLSLLV